MNEYPHISTKDDYSAYERAVAAFFKRERIDNLSPEYGDNCEHECRICGETTGINEGSFCWRPCDCCGRALGGDRYHANGYSAHYGEAYCYSVCGDCIYYAEYGQLDDMTMLEIEEPENYSINLH